MSRTRCIIRQAECGTIQLSDDKFRRKFSPLASQYRLRGPPIAYQIKSPRISKRTILGHKRPPGLSYLFLSPLPRLATTSPAANRERSCGDIHVAARVRAPARRSMHETILSACLLHVHLKRHRLDIVEQHLLVSLGIHLLINLAQVTLRIDHETGAVPVLGPVVIGLPDTRRLEQFRRWDRRADRS